MEAEEKLYDKFPIVLRDKLKNKEIQFPEGTQINYEKIYTYRSVKRKKDDYSKVTRSDFKSYFELGKSPKKARGTQISQEELLKTPEYYGVSSFLDREIVEQKMRFPNPAQKMAAGYVFEEGGPQYTKDRHVCWWLFDEIEDMGFILLEEEKNE